MIWNSRYRNCEFVTLFCVWFSLNNFFIFGMNRCEENSSTLSYLIDQYTVNQERDDDMNQNLDERLYT